MTFRLPLLIILLLAAVSGAVDRAEELALGITEELLGTLRPGPEAASGFDERILTAGSRFIEDAYAAETELLGDPLFVPARRSHLLVGGSLDHNLDGRGRLEHAAELGEFAYLIRGDYGTRERAGHPRNSGGVKLDAGWLPSRGHRVLLCGGYDAWDYSVAPTRQEQRRWFTGALGVWRPADGLTLFARLGFDSFRQTSPGELEGEALMADIGARLFIGADDYLTIDAALREFTSRGDGRFASFELSNTFTLDRILFLTTGLGLAYDGAPRLVYDGAVRLLIGPLSLVSLVAVRRAELPDAAAGRYAVEGLVGGVGPRLELSEDYYLEYSLHLAETSITGVRGGYRRLIEPTEQLLVDSGALERRVGRDREFLVLGAFLDYTHPGEGWGGRWRLEYEFTHPEALRRHPLPEPVPHHAVHRGELTVELSPLGWLGLELGVGYLSSRADGAGGRLPGQLNLGLDVVFSIDDFLRLSLFAENILGEPLRDNAASAPVSRGLGARIFFIL